MRDLREACQNVLAVKHRTEDVINETAVEYGLAPIAGFFFGSLEYDEWYFGDLEYTIKTIDRLEAVGLFDNAWTDIEYQASW